MKPLSNVLTWLSTVIALTAIMPVSGLSQDELRPTVVGERLDPGAAPEEEPYTLKWGPVNFRASTSLRTEFTDNISLSEKSPQSDVTVTPDITIGAFWQATPFNSVHLNTTIGYLWYAARPRQNTGSSNALGAPTDSTVTISPDSSLDWNIYIGHFVINLHDRFSFQQDPVSEPSLSNVSEFGRFTNSTGLDLNWKAGRNFSATLSYDHTELIPSQASFNFEAFSEDQLSFSSRYDLRPDLSVGLEGSASSTRYRTSEKADATSLHAGTFIDFQFSPFTSLRVAGGYQGTFFGKQTGPSVEIVSGVVGPTLVNDPSPQEDISSYYFNLELKNKLTHHFSHSLSIARESALGVTSAATQGYTFSYQANWTPNALWSVEAGASLNIGDTLGGLDPEHYTQLVFNLSATYQVTSRLSGTLGYRYSHKNSNLDLQSYSQNLVSLAFEYSF